MKGKQTALMPGNGDKVGYWLTPPDLMKRLDDEFHFTFDACPYPRPAGFNGLIEEWGERTWVNPPVGAGISLTKWARKAIMELGRGKMVVIVLPLPWWARILLEAGAEVRTLGSVPWMNAKGEHRPSGSGGGKVPDTLFILRPKGEPAPGDREGE